jgi:uncharacterized protein (UPF0276 family)
MTPRVAVFDFHSTSQVPRIGIAYNKYVPDLLADYPGIVDYIEVPYELLEHDPTVALNLRRMPVVLHCATLSIGGSVICPQTTVDRIAHWIAQSETPWLGEHLAFITAERDETGGYADAYAPGEPYNIGYTVSPPMNDDTLGRVVRNLETYARNFSVPVILENSPLYFSLADSTMSQVEFLTRICERTTVGLLLDLAHFHITARTMGFDALQELKKLPLQRVVEVHISGVDEQEGAHWDNHADRAPEAVFRLLEDVLAKAPVRAVTLEYNWSSAFPRSVLLEELARTRKILELRHKA